MVEKVLLLDVELDRESSASQLGKNWAHYPTGVLYLAAALKKKFPLLEIRIFHTSVYDNSIQALSNVLSTYKPDLIGFRALSRFKEQFVEHVLLCKKLLPKAFLIAGGPYPSASYEEVFSRTPVDLVIIGEGEQTIVEVVGALRNSLELPQKISGTVIKVDGEIYKNPERQFIENLDEIPFPDYSLIDIDAYKGLTNHAFTNTNKCAYILSSRGCSFNCFYCHQLFGKKIRRRSPINIVEEMKEKYHKFGIKEFVFLDDIFNVPLRECKETLKLMIAELPNDIAIDFPNGLRADYIDLELICLLRTCGMKNIALAVESASPRVQKYIGKNLNIEKAYKNIDDISREFITTVFYMIGFPTETVQEAKMTIEFAEQLKYVSQPVLSILRVYRNTKIYDFLNPNSIQDEYIKKQECLDLQTKLNSDMHFYGDVFNDEIVPLNSKSINKLRLLWMKKVMMNKERIENSNIILNKFLSKDEIDLFYKDIFDDVNFDVNKLLRR